MNAALLIAQVTERVCSIPRKVYTLSKKILKDAGISQFCLAH